MRETDNREYHQLQGIHVLSCVSNSIIENAGQFGTYILDHGIIESSALRFVKSTKTRNNICDVHCIENWGRIGQWRFKVKCTQVGSTIFEAFLFDLTHLKVKKKVMNIL